MGIRMDTLAGILVLAFGILVGSIGVASAGVGAGLPVIPIGIYLVWRGYCMAKLKTSPTASDQKPDSLDFERGPKGQVGIGIILLLVGIGTSALIIGIPVAIVGGFILCNGIKHARSEKHGSKFGGLGL